MPLDVLGTIAAVKLGGAAVAGTAAAAPSTIEAARSGALGSTKSGITKTALKTLGRGLATL